MTVERPLRLHSQLSLKAIETLRFASGDEEMRAALYDEFGDDLFSSFDQVAAALEKRLAEWGGDDEESQGDDAEDGAGARKGLPEKRRKKLLDPKTWERDGRLVEVATALRETLGDALFEDHNVFRDRVDEALKKAGIKLSTAELDAHPYSTQQIYQRLTEAGYGGGITIVKDYVHRIRPRQQPAFLKLDFEPGECAQVDWGELGTVTVGNTHRRLSFFVMVLCYSRPN